MGGVVFGLLLTVAAWLIGAMVGAGIALGVAAASVRRRAQ